MSKFKHITISYTSPYLVATPRGYTKHYYTESERIASKIGGENFRLTIFDFRMNKLSSNENYLEHNITAGRILSTQYHTLPSSQNRQSKIKNRQSYHPDHLGSSSWITYTDGKSIQHLHYLPFGESFVDQRISSFGSRYTFSAKEKDVETGYGYFGARYYSSDLSIWISVDPMADKYPSMSPYVYCANNPIKLVDPNGEEFGDYYTLSGLWLGTDGINDDKAYTATAKNPDGTFANAKALHISNSELLNRGTWVHGECGGSSELIRDRVQNKGDASSTSDARVADYYAFAINNAVNADGGFDNTIKMRMSKTIGGKTQNTSEGYFSGTGIGGNNNSKNFANARQNGMTDLMNLNGAQTSISAVIKSVTSLNDPTGGARAWLGSSYAKAYQQNPRLFTSGAKIQFSFSSGNGKFYHSFYKR